MNRMAIGRFERDEDVNGVSGVGRVAEWVEFSDGCVVVRWISNMASTNVYQNRKQAESIHGHGGRTRMVVEWEAPDAEVPTDVPAEDDVQEPVE